MMKRGIAIYHRVMKLYHPSRYAADRHRNKSIVIPAQAGIQGFGWWANALIENTD